MPTPVGGSFLSRLNLGPAISSDGSRTGEVGVVGFALGLTTVIAGRLDVLRRSNEGEKVSDLGEVSDIRRLARGGRGGLLDVDVGSGAGSISGVWVT